MTVPAQVVIFGASGDLTSQKLMPALAGLSGEGRPREGFSVVGVARRPKSDEAFRAELRSALPETLLEGFDTLATWATPPPWGRSPAGSTPWPGGLKPDASSTWP
jgi:glucose-6-phosphate 1-dehydrogenase